MNDVIPILETLVLAGENPAALHDLLTLDATLGKTDSLCLIDACTKRQMSAHLTDP